VIIPTHLKRRDVRHAFEIALEEASVEMDAGSDAVPHLAPSLSLSAATSYVAVPSLVAAYRANAAAASKRETPTPLPSPRQAAAELVRKLKSGLTAAELGRLRRRFALENHPDRVPSALREEAAEAMALVNAQVDRALKKGNRQ
jgi:hypothetical protein